MTQAIPVSVILLAAGQSRRMAGESKLFLPFRGKTVIQAVAEMIHKHPFKEVITVIGYDSPKIEQLLKEYCEIKFIRNPGFKNGMGSSIACGISAAVPESRGYAIFLGDMPFLSQQTIHMLIRAFSGSDGMQMIVPVFRGKRGHPVFFSKKYRRDLLALSGDSGARRILETYPEKIMEIETNDAGILADIDTIEDYQRLLDSMK